MTITAFAVILVCATTLIISGVAVECPNILPISTLPNEFNVSQSFYKKYLPGPGGLPIIGSEKVQDEALHRAWYTLKKFTETLDPKVVQKIVDNKLKFVVMAVSERTTNIPEHSSLSPANYWNERVRGLGPTRERPIITTGEENLLCCPLGNETKGGDRYAGECIIIHEFSHAIDIFGLSLVDTNWKQSLSRLYYRAIDKGLWKSTYSATNVGEYWAEAVQSYFDCNHFPKQPEFPGNAININSREKLRIYDPDLFKFIDKAFKSTPWKYSCLSNSSICTGHLSR